MLAFRYDNSFEGLLSAVFDAYTRKVFPHCILGPEDIPPLTVAAVQEVATAGYKADRVFAGLCKRLTLEGKNTVLLAFLSEGKGMATCLFRYIRKVFDAPRGLAVEGDFSDATVLAVDQTARKVYGEMHHLLGFARFQKTAEGLYFSALSPRYNVLSLMLPHFMDRFPTHPWIVYDLRRGFGFHHESGKLSDVTLNAEIPGNGMLPPDLLAPDEKVFQEMWKRYLGAATITERLNAPLQARCLPRRFWPYMTEMRARP